MSNSGFPADFPKDILGLDDTFRFRCTQCGRCCRHREDILVSPYDLFRISRHFSIAPKVAIERYCIAYIGSASRMPLLILKARGKERSCPFLDKNRCSIHRSKPTVCALFPLGRAVSAPTESTEKSSIPEGVFYFLQDIVCGAKDASHTVREWLNSFDMVEGNAWFMVWQKVVLSMSPQITRLEEHLPEKTLRMLFDVMFAALYLDYEDVEEFLPRFTLNAKKLQGLIDLLIQGSENR